MNFTELSQLVVYLAGLAKTLNLNEPNFRNFLKHCHNLTYNLSVYEAHQDSQLRVDALKYALQSLLQFPTFLRDCEESSRKTDLFQRIQLLKNYVQVRLWLAHRRGMNDMDSKNVLCHE